MISSSGTRKFKAAYLSIQLGLNYLRPVKPYPCLVLLFLFGMHSGLNAQDSLPRALIQLGYGYQQSLFDMAPRYGGHGSLQMALILKKNSWEYGLSFQYLFGSRVGEDVLAGLRSPEGELIGEDHQLAQVDLRLRGSLFGLLIGKRVPIQKAGNLVIGVQPGWLIHWIRFQNPGYTFAPIRGAYRYGYDRLSAGPAISEQLAYRYLSSNRLINFELAIHFTQGFTKLKRNIQLDQPNISTSRRFDGLLGIQAKWIVPVFSKKNPDTIYY